MRVRVVWRLFLRLYTDIFIFVFTDIVTWPTVNKNEKDRYKQKCK